MRLLVILSLSIGALASCGGGEQGTPLTKVSGSISGSDSATNIAEMLLGQNSGSATIGVMNVIESVDSAPHSGILPGYDNSQVPALSVAFNANPFDACTKSFGTLSSDVDGDGLPGVSSGYQMDCNGYDNGYYTYNVYQSKFSMVDKDDSVAGLAGGYNYTYTQEVAGVKRGNPFNAIVFYEADTKNNTNELISSVNAYIASLDKDDGWDYLNQTTLTTTFVPSDTNNPSDGGDLQIDGFFRRKFVIDLNMDPSASIEPYDVTLRVRSYNMKYGADAGCAAGFSQKVGRITFTDASGTSISFIYTCSSISAEYLGSVVATKNY